MEFNKSGEINRYYKLDDILKLDISEDLKKEFREKFKKRVFYEKDFNCKTGVLVGLETNYKLSDTYFIIDTGKSIYHYIPTWLSITRL